MRCSVMTTSEPSTMRKASYEEFFTLRIGPLKVNMFTVFMFSLVGCASYYGYYVVVVKPG